MRPLTDEEQVYRSSINLDKEISALRIAFGNLPDTRASNSSHQLSDVLMSGFAMFSLKYPSLLSFEQQTGMEKNNLKNIFGIEKSISDVQLRRILDKIDPNFIRELFPKKFDSLNKAGLLEEFGLQIGKETYHLVSCDGVQHFSSKTVSCECCLKKEHKDGSTTYHHNMLCAVLVHPKKREVFVMDVEPIIQQDGVTKNDCERNAAKRMQVNFAKSYENYSKTMRFLFVEDALYANVPHIKELLHHGFDYLLNVKPGSHGTLFSLFQEYQMPLEGVKKGKIGTFSTIDDDKIHHDFEYINGISLCKSSPDLVVNFVKYTQTDKKGKKTTFTWVTNIELSQDILMVVMRAGRARWKIENETFNTLKNLGYHFEHNYGHGKDHLARSEERRVGKEC